MYFCAQIKKIMREGFSGERSIVLPKIIVDMEEADPLTSSLYVTDIGYYPTAHDHYVKRDKAIDQNVLIYCEKGSGFYEVGGQHYELHTNEYCILPANKPHKYGADKTDPWTIYWIHFKGAHADMYAQGAVQPQYISQSINSRISERNNIFEEIFYAMADSYSQENLRYASSCLHYYLASMRYISPFRNKKNKTQQAEYSVSTIETTIKFMKENIEKSISLKQLADYTGYSPSHFSTLFKQQMGSSPLVYLNQLRIKAACYWLEHTDMKINQICHKVGIDDQYYFSRIFRQHMGMSPKEWRHQQKTSSK